MFFISENFRQQQKTSQPKKHKPKFVSSIPVQQQPHRGGGVAITLISGLIAMMILLPNLKSPPYILLSVSVFVIVNVVGRLIF